jgi:hypothetical protein
VIVSINNKSKSSIFNFCVLILTLFLIVFPKGGIKIKAIPLTWGYLLLGLTSFIIILRKHYFIRKEHIYTLLMLIPFQIYSLISISINGFTKIGFMISFFIGFFVLPFIFLFIFSEYIETLNLDYFFKILKRSIFFIALYGIFLFFYKIFTGSIFEIPFLTINYHDRGLLESIKSIDRGTFFKLISTYNNGNVYGICILMFLPLYNYLEKNKLKRSIVKLSFLLTLSRTVWIGLIISEFLYNFFIKKNKSLSFIKSTISICISIIIIIFLGKLMNIDISWFFDPTLGNRLNPEYFDIKLFSHIAFEHIEEMLYLSILHIFGVVGFIFFIIGFFSPIIIFTLKNYMKKIANINKVIFLGLINYFIISIADAAILYIPTIAIFWFLSTFLFTNKKVNSNFA